MFVMNSAENGGVIYALVSNVSITRSVFIANQAYRSGGAIYTSTSTLVIEDSVFSENRAGILGGAVLARDSIIRISGSGNSLTNDQAVFGAKYYNTCMMNSIVNRFGPRISTAANMLIHSTTATPSSITCFYNKEGP